MKHYLYHKVPREQRGTILYPLNTLRDIAPDLYAKLKEMYKGREKLMEQIIPGFNCLWNDVIHMAAVHPLQIKTALEEAGLKFPPMKVYEIDPQLLSRDKTLVYLNNRMAHNELLKPEHFVPYDPDDLERYSILPDETKRYYKKASELDYKPLLWHGVPHILYKGTLDTSLLKVIEV